MSLLVLFALNKEFQFSVCLHFNLLLLFVCLEGSSNLRGGSDAAQTGADESCF